MPKKTAQLSDLTAWCHTLYTNPERAIAPYQRACDLYTTKHLIAIYTAHNPRHNGVSKVMMGRALRRAGFPAPRATLCGLVTRKLIAVTRRTYWAKQNGEQWSRCYTFATTWYGPATNVVQND